MLSWLRRHRTRALVLLCAALSASESATILGVGLQAAQGMGPQASAVWPYDSYHDLRWILVYHRTVPQFLILWGLMVLFRGLVTGGIVWLAWPDEVPRPGLRWLVKRNTVIAAGLGALLMPWAALNVGAAAVALSWYLFAALVPLFVLSPFLVRASVSADWYKGLPSRLVALWTLATFLAITVEGWVLWVVPGWWNLPVVIVAGAINALVWQRTVRACLQRPQVLYSLPVAPIAIVLMMLAPVAVRAATAATTNPKTKWPAPILERMLPPSVPYAVVAIAGYNSFYDGAPPVDPRVQRFSYRGLEQGRPRPYEQLDTHQSIDRSAELLRTQVDELARRTGRPVALIGQSEGALVVRRFLQENPRSRVQLVLYFSPLLRSGRTYWPPPEESRGWGVVTGWQLRVLFAASNLASRTQDSPDSPVVRSVLDGAPLYRAQMLCPVPGVRSVAFIPTVSAIEAPPGEYARIEVRQEHGFHASLLGRRKITDEAEAVLEGKSVSRPFRWYWAWQYLGAPWQAPPLAMSVNPVWNVPRRKDPSLSGKVCVDP